MNEQALEIAVSFIKPWEGLCLRAYPDPASPLSKALSARNLLAKYKRGEAEIPADLRSLSGAPWTLFYGETQGITEGMTGTLEQAESRLKARVQRFMQEVLKASPKLAEQAPEALAAATSLSYNIGMGDEHHNPPIPGYATSTLRKKIAVEDWQAAADAILLWNRAGGQVVDGLVNRRKAERELFLSAFTKPASVPKVDTSKANTPIVAEKPVIVENKSGGIMSKLWALLALFKKGSAVANPALWRLGQVTGNMLGALILAIVQTAKVFGYELPIDTAMAYAVGGGIISIANAIIPVITSKRIGLSVAPEQAGAGIPSPVEPEAQPEAPSVQHVSISDVATAVADVGEWLAKAHANATGERRADDESYRGV